MQMPIHNHNFQAEESHRNFFPTYTTAVAVDKDKNSVHAVKWAVDHLLVNTPVVVLIHVRNPAANHHGFSMTEVSAEASREQIESEMAQLFLPFRGFCSRKGTQIKEIVVEETDVTRGLVDYINCHHISNIVVGASSRNAIFRKFKNQDVPTGLMKSAPDFCTVYVISKGKTTAVRSAKSHVPTSMAPPRHPTISPQLQLDEPLRSPFSRGGAWRGASPSPPMPERRSFERGGDYVRSNLVRERTLSTAKPVPLSMLTEGMDINFRYPRAANSRESLSGEYEHLAPEFRADAHDFSAQTNELSPTGSSSPRATNDVEAEMKRLKLELKQTMDMYSTACKEAINAKQKEREFQQWKLEEARRIEEARQAQEAALALAEVEKAKCRAAMEAAHHAQRVAEMEAQKRHSAEQTARREFEEKKKALEALAHNDIRYRKYSITEIEAATNMFNESLKIGEGGYGPVYRAYLDHTPVAIKVLRPDAAQGRRQFQQEVEILSCIRHPNMVLLLGACPEYGCLVYEYMDNGSLDDRLFRRDSTPTIPWSVRFKIAAEIATALLFLHQTKPEPLVHRDLKPANILLDRNYVSKISDVGLARLVPPSVADSVTQYRMTSTAGTFCYIDPEYQQTGMLGIKSDIYSLGIMLLQIVTAKPPMGLTHHVQWAIDRGAIAEILDPTVEDWPMEEALGFVKLALKCSELRRKDRPDLGTVILPHLNKLRNLGRSWEESQGNAGGAFGRGSYSFPAHSRAPSQSYPERAASNPQVGA